MKLPQPGEVYLCTMGAKTAPYVAQRYVVAVERTEGVFGTVYVTSRPVRSDKHVVKLNLASWRALKPRLFNATRVNAEVKRLHAAYLRSTHALQQAQSRHDRINARIAKIVAAYDLSYADFTDTEDDKTQQEP
jgi:hypothetical protein